MVENECNGSVLEEFFSLAMDTVPDFVTKEAKINQSARLSHGLLRHVRKADLSDRYTKAVTKELEKATQPQEQSYCIIQLATAFQKSSVHDEAVLELLLRVNYSCNHGEVESDQMYIETARAALLRCLEVVVASKNLKQVQKLVSIAESIYKNEELSGVCRQVLQFWETGDANNDVKKTNKKKRRASEASTVCLDMANRTNAMFVALLGNLALFLCTQPLDPEMLEIIEDIKTCFKKARDSANAICPPNKRQKTETNSEDNEPEMSWNVVLTDALVILLEQGCRYLRSLSRETFQTLVQEGNASLDVIEHIGTTLQNSEGLSCYHWNQVY